MFGTGTDVNDIAVKAIRHDATTDDAKRFRREIRLLSELVHPNIVTLLWSKISEDFVCYAMPLRETNLRDRLRDGSLSPPLALSIAQDLIAAVAYAHEHTIHRDIKPENILLNGDIAELSDLGIAKALEHLSGDNITKPDVVLGTPEYMAPEQFSALGGKEADVYAIGAVIYEMFMGERPLSHLTHPDAISEAHRKGQMPVNMRTGASYLEPALSALVMKCLAKASPERPTAQELAAAFHISDRRLPIEVPRQKRNRVLHLVMLVVVLGVAVTLVIFSRRYSQVPDKSPLPPTVPQLSRVTDSVANTSTVRPPSQRAETTRHPTSVRVPEVREPSPSPPNTTQVSTSKDDLTASRGSPPPQEDERASAYRLPCRADTICLYTLPNDSARHSGVAPMTKVWGLEAAGDGWLRLKLAFNAKESFYIRAGNEHRLLRQDR